MDIKSLEIKTETNYNWDDIFYINDFDPDLLKIIKRESRIGTNIYYIEYILEPHCLNFNIKPLNFVINRLIGYIEEIEESSDKYLVVSKSMCNNKIIHSFDTIRKIIENEITSNNFSNNFSNKIKDYDKFRFNSDIDLPLDMSTEFPSLVINVSCVSEQDNEYYPEIYLNECLYVKNNI